MNYAHMVLKNKTCGNFLQDYLYNPAYCIEGYKFDPQGQLLNIFSL